jgi:hypothetical protein
MMYHDRNHILFWSTLNTSKVCRAELNGCSTCHSSCSEISFQGRGIAFSGVGDMIYEGDQV